MRNLTDGERDIITSLQDSDMDAEANLPLCERCGQDVAYGITPEDELLCAGCWFRPVPSTPPASPVTLGRLDEWAHHLEHAMDERVAVLQHGPGVYTALSTNGGGVYGVVIMEERGAFYVTCICPAGEHGKRCKHAAAALVAEGLIELSELAPAA